MANGQLANGKWANGKWADEMGTAGFTPSSLHPFTHPDQRDSLYTPEDKYINRELVGMHNNCHAGRIVAQKL